MKTLMQGLRQFCWLLFISGATFILTSVSQAQTTFNLSNGSYPTCSTSWSVNGSTYTCTGDGKVNFPNGAVVTANTASTIVARNGFQLRNNSIGSAANSINLQSDYGDIDANGTNAIYGNLQTYSGQIDLDNTSVSGSITATGGGADIIMNGGSVAGSVTAGRSVTLEGVTMTNGNIYGAGGVSLEDSNIGTSSSPVAISTNYAAINVEDSTVYGDLTAPDYSEVNVDNSTVFGECRPRSNPEGACSPAPPSCPAGSPLAAGIIGQYFNNTSLSGSVVNTRLDNQINFNWGNSAPGVTGINSDRFSVRWEGLLLVKQTGNYRFQTSSDDGVRLWINGSRIINNWTDHADYSDESNATYLTAGEVYSIRLEFYENGGQALIQLRWDLPGGWWENYVPIPAGTTNFSAGLYHCAQAEICGDVEPSGGIQGEYFNNTALTGNSAGTRIDGPIDFLWNQSAPGVTGVNGDKFSIRWDGRLRATVTGNYQFQTRSDDGVRLWIDDQQLINQWNDHSATEHTSNSIELVAGQVYSLRLEFYENLVDAEIRLRWKIPGSNSFVPIPRGPTPTVGAGLYYCPTTPAVSHYVISAPATAVTCEAAPITVTAMDANDEPVAPPANTVAVLTAVPTGTWIGGNGYSFSGSETSFIKYLQQTTPATLEINVTDGTTTALAEIVFSDAGLRFYNDTALNPLANIFAGVTNTTAIVRAIKTNTDTGACEARAVGTQTIKLGYECINPTTCSSGQTFTANNVAIAANNTGSFANLTNTTVNFNSSGTAKLPLNFSDVGQVRLHGQLSLLAQAEEPAITLTGSSNSFVVKPYTLAVTAVPGNPGTTNSGAGFIVAGEAFSVEVQARNAAGNPTPNFGRELTSELNKLSLNIADLIYPAAGDIGFLANNTGNFSLTAPAGTLVNNTVTWSEVGTIQLEAALSDEDYLGAGDIAIKTPSGPVGRFYPSHFALEDVQLANACNDFTYMGQGNIPLKYQLEAKSASDATVVNYTESIYTGTAKPQYHAEYNNNLDLSARVVASEVQWNQGVLIFDTTAASLPAMFSIARQASGVPDGPFDHVAIGLSLGNEIDNRQLATLDMNAASTGNCESGNNCTAKKLGDNLNLRYGRMHIKDAFGSEFSPLPMFWQAEYWNGSNFVLNYNDSCTRLALSRVTFVDASTSINAATDTIAVTRGGITSSFDFSGNSGDVEGGLSGTEILFAQGRAGISYGAPGAQITYPIKIDLTDLPYLHYDWNQDGDYWDLGLPKVEINFSHYRGHDRIIYWREDFN